MGENEVQLSDGSSIATQTVIWTAGTSPNTLVAELPCQLDRGRIVTNPCLEVAGWPGVWALGDCASTSDPKTGRPYPATAQHHVRENEVQLSDGSSIATQTIIWTGATFTSASCLVLKRRSGWHWIGLSTCYSQRISCRSSICTRQLCPTLFWISSLAGPEVMT